MGIMKGLPQGGNGAKVVHSGGLFELVQKNNSDPAQETRIQIYLSINQRPI